MKDTKNDAIGPIERGGPTYFEASLPPLERLEQSFDTPCLRSLVVRDGRIWAQLKKKRRRFPVKQMQEILGVLWILRGIC